MTFASDEISISSNCFTSMFFVFVGPSSFAVSILHELNNTMMLTHATIIIFIAFIAVFVLKINPFLFQF
jgi:hypothetical protein